MLADSIWLQRRDREVEEFILAEHKRMVLQSWTDRIETDKVFKTAVLCAIVALMVGLAAFTALQWLWE